MIWLAVVGTVNQSNAITMMSLLWWGALTNQNHSWPMGVHHRSLLWEVTTGGSMIWLAVVGTLNQSNTITMMSLLWWKALTNQNHSWPVGVYHRSSLWEFTVGVYHKRLLWEVQWSDWLWWGQLTNKNHSWPVGVYCGGHCRRSPWEFTVGGYCRSSPWEVTAGVYHGTFNDLIWLAVVGTVNQSNAITVMSLLWWGALTNQNHSWPMGVYCRRSLWEFTIGVYSGRSPWEFTIGVYHGILPWEVTTGVYCRRLPWEFTTGVYRRRLPREVTVGVNGYGSN